MRSNIQIQSTAKILQLRLGTRTHASEIERGAEDERAGTKRSRVPPYACHLFTPGDDALCGSDCLSANCLHGHRFFSPTGTDSQGNVGHLCSVFLLFRRGLGELEGEGNVCLLPFVVFRWNCVF